MSILPIYNCFHPILKQKTEDVKDINSEIDTLIKNMFETMYKADGIGLAANQVGINKSIIVIDTSVSKNREKDKPIVLINPIIEAFSEEKVEYQEGCLSIPTFFEKVIRPDFIRVRFFDLNSKEHILEPDSLQSRVIQHEIDHLNGILFFERLTQWRKTLAKTKLKKIQDGKIRPNYKMVLPDGTII